MKWHEDKDFVDWVWVKLTILVKDREMIVKADDLGSWDVYGAWFYEAHEECHRMYAAWCEAVTRLSASTLKALKSTQEPRSMSEAPRDGTPVRLIGPTHVARYYREDEPYRLAKRWYDRHGAVINELIVAGWLPVEMKEMKNGTI